MTNNFINLHLYHLASVSKRRSGKGRSKGVSFSKLLPQLPNWGSLLFGMLIGIFLTSLIVFTFSTSDITLKIPTGSAKQIKQNTVVSKIETVEEEVADNFATTGIEVATAAQEPRFDFYTELTKSNSDSNQPVAANPIVTKTIQEPTIKSMTIASSPNPVKATLAKPKALDLKSAPKAINGYLVQAGHFRRNADADALKAKLTLNGFDAKIAPSKISNGDTWYRILLGPFKNEQGAKDFQQQLKAIDVESVLVLKYAD